MWRCESIGSTLRLAARTFFAMKPRLSGFVSLHPYFKVHEGKVEAFKAALPEFVKKAAAEEKCLYYGFTVDGDQVFCREAYSDADGLLFHIENVFELLSNALLMADVVRFEVHGPAAELARLHAPLSHLKPTWFVSDVEVTS